MRQFAAIRRRLDDANGAGNDKRKAAAGLVLIENLGPGRQGKRIQSSKQFVPGRLGQFVNDWVGFT
jgi:hypothetical protein